MSEKSVPTIVIGGCEVHENFPRPPHPAAKIQREQATAGLPLTDDDWCRFLLGDETA